MFCLANSLEHHSLYYDLQNKEQSIYKVIMFIGFIYCFSGCTTSYSIWTMQKYHLASLQSEAASYKYRGHW